VEDNGHGIPGAERKTLFHPFHSTKPGGSGLALVLARKLLARMNATIEVESEDGEGTTVSVTLDRAEAAA
jgi:signal transduction histidine kinase